jgi:hypothetical protein
MKSKLHFLFIAILFICLFNAPVKASNPFSLKESKNFDLKNIVYLQLDNHFEQRGENGNIYSNPEFAIGYDRRLFGMGKNHLLLGLKTGYYYETALTARNYDHTYHHPFVGLYPSYIFAPTKWFKIQVAGAWDIIFETHDDLDDFWWWYFGIEPSIQFYPVKNMYLSIGATMGKLPWFEPPVTITKAFIKTGFCF